MFIGVVNILAQMHNQSHVFLGQIFSPINFKWFSRSLLYFSKVIIPAVKLSK